MKYTIKQISELAHVAQSTVSKALNGQKGVSEEKRREILKLAGEMNYHPNANARALAHQKTENIGLIIPSTESFSYSGLFWSEIIAAIAEEANRQDYNLLLIVPSKEAPLKTVESAILKRTVDGLVIPAEQLTVQEINMLEEYDVPFVLQGRSVLCDKCSVDVRNEDGAEKLARRLIAKGCRKIACIAGPETFCYTQDRVRGFKKAMSENGLSPSILVYTQYTKEAATESVRTLLKEHPDIDAMFVTAGAEFLFYIIDVLREARVNLKRFCVAVFDDYLPFHYLPFNVIAARQPIHEMGTQDAKNLFQLINKEPTPSLSLFDISISE